MLIGTALKLPQDASLCSIDGKSREKIDAENIIPDASPNVIVLMVFDILLKKNINKAPIVVIKQGKIKHKILAVVKLIFRILQNQCMQGGKNMFLARENGSDRILAG